MGWLHQLLDTSHTEFLPHLNMASTFSLALRVLLLVSVGLHLTSSTNEIEELEKKWKEQGFTFIDEVMCYISMSRLLLLTFFMNSF